VVVTVLDGDDQLVRSNGPWRARFGDFVKVFVRYPEDRCSDRWMDLQYSMFVKFPQNLMKK